MKDVENADLLCLLEALQEHCVSRDSVLWQQYCIDELIKNGGDACCGLGSKRVQFYKHCGQKIYFDLSRGSE
jgi:hypothetical protein